MASMRPILIAIIILTCLFFPKVCFSEEGIYTDEYYISIYPGYPPSAGEKITLRLRTFKPAQKVTLFSDREEEIPLIYRSGYWWGKFQIPADYKEGGHYFTVAVRYPFPPSAKPSDVLFKLAKFFKLKKDPGNAFWSRSVVWYRMLGSRESRVTGLGLAVEVSEEAYEETVPVSTGEAIAIKVPSLEALPFLIKGSKTLIFSSKSIEGSKEGFVPGATREESLRLNISGKSEDTEIDANLISTSTAGSAQVAQREEKISVLLKRASTEAYLGDFTAELNETEFAKLNKVLSGVRVKGDYEKWGFNALYSSPKGEAKFKRLYGDSTQGPFKLDSAPVVINSERVYVDTVLQKRGDDYLVDYQAGTVTFVKKTIDPRSILDIYYDYRQTLYSHATYGLRLTAQPLPFLKVGGSYLNDSDALAGAAETKLNLPAGSADPQGHYVIGSDIAVVSEGLSLNGEAAYSNKNYNLLSPGREESGRAVKLDLTSQLGPFGITGHGKRIGLKFLPVADPNPKQDVAEYAGGLSFRPSSLFAAQGSYNYENYLQNNNRFENSYRAAKTGLTPENLPSLEYNYSDNSESNDPVTGGKIERIITRNSAETIYRLGFISTSLKGVNEKWLRRSPSEEVTDYRKVNFGLATAGIEKLTFASNVELESRREPSGAAPFRRTYNLNLSASPAKPYFISTSLEHLNDSALGIKDVTDLSYRAEPHEVFRTDGKYTITSVKEDLATTEAVSKQAGSFSFDFRPFPYLRLRHQIKPNFTKVLRTDTLSFSNEQQQSEVNLIPLKEVILGVLYKVGHGFNISKKDLNYKIKENTADTDSTLYTLKMAPFQILSAEFNYLLENGRTTALATTEPLSYNPGQSFGKKYDVIIKTSLTERFSVDSRYTYQKNTQGTGEAAANLADAVGHTAALKGTWNISDLWSVSFSGAYSKSTNLLSSAPATYTVTPGVEVSYREGEKVRVDFGWTNAKSSQGAETEKTNYLLRAKYSLSDYVNITLRGEQEISRVPNYKLTDITGNVEINL